MRNNICAGTVNAQQYLRLLGQTLPGQTLLGQAFAGQAMNGFGGTGNVIWRDRQCTGKRFAATWLAETLLGQAKRNRGKAQQGLQRIACPSVCPSPSVS